MSNVLTLRAMAGTLVPMNYGPYQDLGPKQKRNANTPSSDSILAVARGGGGDEMS